MKIFLLFLLTAFCSYGQTLSYRNLHPDQFNNTAGQLVYVKTTARLTNSYSILTSPTLSGATNTAVHVFTDGSAANPSITFLDKTTGFYKSGNSVGLSIQTSLRHLWTAAVYKIGSGLKIGWSKTATSDGTTGLSLDRVSDTTLALRTDDSVGYGTVQLGNGTVRTNWNVEGALVTGLATQPGTIAIGDNDGSASVTIDANHAVTASYTERLPATAATGFKWGELSGSIVTHSYKNPVMVYEFAISDETTAITAGNGKITWRAPHAMTIVGVRASLTTASSSGVVTFDINEGGTTIMAVTKLTIDATEKTSTTAAALAVISDTAIADDAEVTIDVDGAGTGSAGGKIKIYYTRAW